MINVEITTTKTYATLDDLIRKHNYIGFVSPERGRYMVVTGGSGRGLAVRPGGTWVTKDKQPTEPGRYEVFSSSRELYAWLEISHTQLPSPE